MVRNLLLGSQGVNGNPYNIPNVGTSFDRVIYISRYKDKARDGLARVFPNPQHPKEDIKFWVKYIIQNGGSHLRSVALDVPLYQKLYLDLASIILGIVLFISILLASCCCCGCKGRTMNGFRGWWSLVSYLSGLPWQPRFFYLLKLPNTCFRENQTRKKHSSIFNPSQHHKMAKNTLCTIISMALVACLRRLVKFFFHPKITHYD